MVGGKNFQSCLVTFLNFGDLNFDIVRNISIFVVSKSASGEMVDTLPSGGSAARRVSSTLILRTCEGVSSLELTPSSFNGSFYFTTTRSIRRGTDTRIS